MELNRVLRYLITGGLFLLLLTPLVVSKSLYFPYITGKAFFFRIIMEIIFALWLYLAWRDPGFRPRRSWLLFGVVGLVAVSALATIFGQNPHLSFWSNFERMDGLVSYLHLLAYFLVISSVFRTEKIWQWFFHSLLGVGLVMASYGLAQLTGALSFNQDRLDATLGNPIYLAVFMLFQLFIVVFLMWKHWHLVWRRWVYGLLMVFQLFILYQTATRGAILGLIAGGLVAALVVTVKGWNDRRIRSRALGLTIVIVALVSIFWLGRDSAFVRQSPVLSRFANISTTETTTESRLTIWKMSLRGFRERPVLGWGPENYNLVFNKYYEPKLWRQEQWFDRSHNIFLDWLIDAGILGLGAYLSLFVAALYYLWRRSRHDLVTKGLFTGLLAAYLINNIFVFDNLTSYLLFFSVLAYWHYHALEPRATAPVIKKAPAPAAGWSVAVVLAVLCLGAIYYVNVRAMSAGVALIRGLSPAAPGSDPTATAKRRLSFFEKVFAADTLLSKEASEQFATQAINIVRDPAVAPETKQQVANLALAQMRKAIERAPQDARLYLIAGSLASNLGQTKEALSFLNQANRLSPTKQTIMFPLAAAYLDSGDKKPAVEIAARAFQLDERFSEARRFYALMLIYNNNQKLADEIIAAGGPEFALDDRFINVYVAQKRYDLVLKLWQDKVKNDPTNPQNHFSLAAAYLAAGSRTKAIEELQTTITLEPKLKEQAEQIISEIRAGRNPLQK